MTTSGNILLVDDDPDLRRLLSLRLESAGYGVTCAESVRDALGSLSRSHPDLVITDLRMPEADGMTLIGELAQEHPTLPVIVLTAHGTIPEAVTATQKGALDFLTKPVDRNALFDRIEQALGSTRTSDWREVWADRIITRSPVMQDLLGEACLVADSDAAVLITGDSGTGKELLAHAIHDASPRADKPFVAINCGALPEPLLESELFGHEKGAFTDAKQSRQGLFRQADGGTILLDEIGDMPPALQVKLLRVLQESEVYPVGGDRALPVDVRVVSATHRNLPEAQADGSFREDLYYRLNVVNLQLPSLTKRREDIPLLANHFLRMIAQRQNQAAKVYAPEAMEELAAADWPGNIRQLGNAVEQNVALTRGPVIPAEQVRKTLKQGGGDGNGLPPLHEARDAFIRDYLIRLLQITGGNVARSARMAERNRSEFYKLLSRHGIEPGEFKT